MMSFRDLDIGISYNTSKDDLIKDFFVPLLQNSISYDRGVGYFSSGWIRETFFGMSDFAMRGAKARWITSPILSQEDWDAIVLGDKAKNDEILKRSLLSTITDLQGSLKEETLLNFAWMIADGIIEFRLAKPRNKLSSEFHAKIGIFTDMAGDSISFDGSYNDSINGLNNFESLKVFKSWEVSSEYVHYEKQVFEKLWTNQDPNVIIFDIPLAAKKSILQLIAHTSRPYNKPENLHFKSFFDLIEIDLPEPHIPSNVSLRTYQLEAINKWATSGYKGILEMATGTGKTITALSGVVNLLSEKRNLFTIIVCPYIHLGAQWQQEAEKFGFRPILVAESKNKWLEKLTNLLRNFTDGRVSQGSLITTNASFMKGDLINLLKQYDIFKSSILIADEMHHCGSIEMLKVLPEETPFRLGLSATPIREYDEFGSDALMNYFGDIVFSFGLKDAIEKGFLTPYYYYPYPVNLLDNEFEKYIDFSLKLQRLHPNSDEPISEAALKIAIQRARVLNNSMAKVDWLRSNIPDNNDMAFTIFYAGDQIFSKVLQTLGYEKEMIVHQFTHEQTMSERAQLIESFAQKKYQALIAMKCLDEGVDIPPTRTAYFLASSSVSREFVQRRGRILRNSPGKKNAKVIDLISIPPVKFIKQGKFDENYKIVRSAIRREFARMREFSSLALNKHSSLDNFIDLVNNFDLLDI